MSRRDDIARTISRVTNPCFLSVGVLILIAGTNSVELWTTVSHVAVIVLGLGLLPIAYVLEKMAGRGTRAERLGDLVDYLKEHPKDVGTLGVVFGLPCVVVLFFLEASSFLVAALTSLLACSLLIASFRGLYKISYHLAGVTCLVIMAAVTWAPVFAATAAVFPALIWSRHLLQEHTLDQMVTGSALAVVVCFATLYGFGLL